MVLRSSISNTRKFFQKTLENFKTFFSNGYQKLPKSANCNPYTTCIITNSQTSFRGSDRIHEFKWEEVDDYKDNSEKAINKNNNNKISLSSSSSSQASRKQHKEGQGTKNNASTQQRAEEETRYLGRKFRPLREREVSCFKVNVIKKETRRFPVKEKLREVEMMIMDIGDMNEHVLDVEEFLHYYSRLHCPAYLDIIESFFMEMYAELISTVEPPRKKSC